MSATTRTSSPLFENVIVPVTWLPDFGSNFATAFVTSCPCATIARAHNMPKEIMIVFMLERYGASARNETTNPASVDRDQHKHRCDDRGKTASECDADRPRPN